MHRALLLPEMLEGICAELGPEQDPSRAALRALMTVNRAFGAAAVETFWADCTPGDLVHCMPPELWYAETEDSGARAALPRTHVC
jgi:hypothetical protein